MTSEINVQGKMLEIEYKKVEQFAMEKIGRLAISTATIRSST
jgi:hypothetical protein